MEKGWFCLNEVFINIPFSDVGTSVMRYVFQSPLGSYVLWSIHCLSVCSSVLAITPKVMNISLRFFSLDRA